jgi:large subunit ribosomal protein L17
MRHLKFGKKLGRTADNRNALLSSLAMAILDKERVITTLAKAKAARSVVERLISFAKKGGLNSIRIAAKTVTDKYILNKLFNDIGPSYKDREGGYTRILKLGERYGDNALTCIFELTGRNSEEVARKRKKQRKAAGTPSDAAVQAEGKTTGKPAVEKKPEAVAKTEKKEKSKDPEKQKKSDTNADSPSGEKEST